MKAQQLSARTYTWYIEHKRDLPWRKTKDPYCIWVSEVMSQQTQLDRVIPYYERFIEKLPTVHELAVVDEVTLLKLWEGLGYYSRVRNMQHAAQYIVNELSGIFPTTYRDILQLKGVGPYIAGAIAGICFDERVSAVDGNVIRLFARVYEIQDDIRQQKTIKHIQRLAEQTLEMGNVGDVNQGYIELGALICTPKNPKCLECPLQTICQCFESQTVGAFPYKSSAKRQKEYDFVACIVEDAEGNIYIEQREMELLHHQWQFPMFEQAKGEAEIIQSLEKLFESKVSVKGNGEESVRHVFSHQIWNITAKYFRVERRLQANEYLTEESHLITAHKKIIESSSI